MKIGVIRGDGTGPEVVAEGLKVLEAVRGDAACELVEFDLGAERFQEVAASLEAQGLYRRDVISTTKSGVQLDIELSAFTVRDGGGAPVCYVGIKRDISQRKRMEEALQFLAAASAALDRSLEYQATVENGPRPTHSLWRIVRADRRADKS